MISAAHKLHLADSTSHARCSECRADTERQFARNTPFRYAHVHEYLTYVRPRIEALRTAQGETVEARIWHRKFLKAMHRRISSHAAGNGRKHADSYVERLRAANWRGNHSDALYFRQFAQRGASCLDY